MSFAFMRPVTFLLIAGVGLCAGMLLCSRVAFRFGLRHKSVSDDQFTVVETATLGLVALLLAFTFQVSMSRFEEARQLIVSEANAIGTAYLRLDLLESSDGTEIRGLFRTYLEDRIQIYEIVSSGGDSAPIISQTRKLQQKIWSRVLESSRRAPLPNAPLLLVPVINQMIDITTARIVSLRTRLPALVKGLLFVLALISSAVIGYAMGMQRRRSPVPVVIFSLIVSATIYTVLDLDSPRYGLIRLDTTQQALQDLKEEIK